MSAKQRAEEIAARVMAEHFKPGDFESLVSSEPRVKDLIHLVIADAVLMGQMDALGELKEGV